MITLNFMIDLETVSISELIREIREGSSYQKHQCAPKGNTPKNMGTYPIKCKYFLFAKMNKDKASTSLTVRRSLKNCHRCFTMSVNKDGEASSESLAKHRGGFNNRSEDIKAEERTKEKTT